MMKKILRFTALFLVLVTLFTLPASADDYISSNDSWLNVLDYTLANGGSSQYAGNECTFTLPMTVSLFGIDMVVRGSVDSVTCNGHSLRVLAIGLNMYRCYGTIGGATNTLSFVFEGTESVNFKSLKVLTSPDEHFSDVTYFSVKFDGTTTSATMPSIGEPATISFGITPSYELPESYAAIFYFNNWQKYDYVDLRIYGRVHSIASIECYLDDIFLPFEISYMPCSESYTIGGLSDFSGRYDADNGTFEFDSENVGVYPANVLMYFTVRVDLRGLDRTSTNLPRLVVSGVANGVDGSYFTISQYSGYVVSDYISPLNYFIKSINSNISALSNRIAALFGDLHIWMNETTSTIVSNVTALFGNLHTWLDDCTYEISSRLDKLIGDSSEGDELEEDSQQLQDDIAGVSQFEQSQQDVLDNSFPEIQSTVALTGFTSALAFVQRYTNMIFGSIGDVSIIFTLPIFLGLFFYICSRVPGATRWSSRVPQQNSQSSNVGGKKNG